MKAVIGLSRQIILSMSAVVLCVVALAVVGSYIFYALISKFWPSPELESDAWLPTDWAWIGIITGISLTVGVAVASKLARRILMPLNSVASSLRSLADGDLEARAVAPCGSLNEATILVDDFNSMAKRLKHMAAEQSFWNATIAHELLTPLTILRGRLQGVFEGVFEPDKAQFNSLLSQVEGLTRLIDDLRVISLADSSHLKVQLRASDLAEEIEADVSLFESSLQAVGFVVQLDLTRNWIVCDSARIRQALLALMDNVRQHATPGTITLRLESKNGFNHLSVTDEGPGISEAYRRKIFDPFHRGDSSRSRSQGGSGLGLAVVRAIALAHEGTVSCRNEGNGGTKFQLSWPTWPSRPMPKE
ncbi:ATP-binding protein [Pseudomonas proteolytica]|uniref:ATP-binding protein n=1 Tax=Pseudomonas proteolytica TaxID=219574 RepID=UPI00320B124A